MKPPSNVAKLPGAAARQSVRLTAKDLAQVRAIAATANARIGLRRRPLLFSGAHAALAAEALAKRLRRDPYRIDLSAVVSKYIGETEKNLDRVFAKAEADGAALLLFDEADALFGKRTNVKDSHDRYANVRINYLLQRAEAYDGLVVLASKPRLTLPTAFRRRFSVHGFPPS